MDVTFRGTPIRPTVVVSEPETGQGDFLEEVTSERRRKKSKSSPGGGK